MEKNKDNKKIIFLSVIALLLSFFIIAMYLVPKMKNLKTLSTQAAAKQAELDAGVEQVKAIRTAAQLIKAASKDIETLGISIPEQSRAEEALAQLGASASKSDVQVKSVSIGGGASGTLKITLSISGGFDQTMTFISNLEKNLRPIEIEDYTIASVEGGSLDTSFNLNFPYLQSEKAAAEATEGEVGEGEQPAVTEGVTK